jgi:hypothetical protein
MDKKYINYMSFSCKSVTCHQDLNLVYEFPEDVTDVPKHVAVLKTHSLVHSLGIINEHLKSDTWNTQFHDRSILPSTGLLQPHSRHARHKHRADSALTPVARSSYLVCGTDECLRTRSAVVTADWRERAAGGGTGTSESPAIVRCWRLKSSAV